MNFGKTLRIAAVVASLAPGLALAAKHQAKLSMEEARKIALAKVGGTIMHDEMEKEHGRWIYSIEIRPTGETGKHVKEVNLDADTGEIVSVEDEKD